MIPGWVLLPTALAGVAVGLWAGIRLMTTRVWEEALSEAIIDRLQRAQPEDTDETAKVPDE